MNLKINNYKYINMYVGIVYRIFYDDLSYIGSTIDLKERIWNHIYTYKNNIGFCSSKEILCYDDYQIEVLAEIYNMDNIFLLRQIEREYMEQYKCVNKNKPIITNEERRKNMKEYNKKYKETDKRKNNKKEYRKLDKAKNKAKEYEKSDKRKQYKKEYYLKNKSK